MKLVDVTPYFHSRSGGIRRYLLQKVAYLKNTPIEHVLIIPGKEKKTYYMESTRVYELPSFPLPLTGGYRFFYSLSEIRGILQEEAPDIVEVGGSYQPLPYLKSDHYLLTAFYHSDIKTDLFLIPGPDSLKGILMSHVIGKKLSKPDIVITPSKKQEELLKGFGLERVMTVNLGVDTSLFSPFRRNPHFSKLLGIENKHKLLYVGRLSVDKNISLLLEVFQYLDPSLFHLVIVGDGPLRRKVEKLSKKLPNLTYLGYVHREEDLAEIYASCDIYVSASYRETYGLSFLEAQACGCILVSFDMDLETQPFKDFLVKEKSRKDFYKAIIRASNSLSPSLREEISSYIAKNFSWNSAFERLLNIYIAESLLTKS